MAKDDIDGVSQLPKAVKSSPTKEVESTIDAADAMWAKEIAAAKVGPRRPCMCCRANPENPGKRYAWQGFQLVLIDCPLCSGTKINGVL